MKNVQPPDVTSGDEAILQRGLKQMVQDKAIVDLSERTLQVYGPLPAIQGLLEAISMMWFWLSIASLRDGLEGCSFLREKTQNWFPLNSSPHHNLIRRMVTALCSVRNVWLV